MAWYTDKENSKILSSAFDGTISNTEAEEIFEAVTLSPDQIKSFASKFGLETTKDNEGDYLTIPTDNFKNAEFTSQFLDFWIGNTPEKLALEQQRKIRNNSYKLMDDILGEATLALDMYADEGVGMGFLEQPIDITIKSNNEQVEKDVKEILKRNEFIKHSRSHIRDLAKFGDFGTLIELPEGNDPLGIKLKIFTPDTWVAFSPCNCKVPVGYSLQPITKKKSYNQTSYVKVSKKDVLQPWEFVQFSVYDSEYAPYGRGLLEGLRTSFDQLVTIEALLAMSRATRVERLVVKVPTGQTNPTAALTKLSNLKSRFKNSIFNDSGIGRKSYSNTPAMQDVLFIPADEGFDIDRMASGSGVEISSTDDVEYFRDKLLMVSGIPKGILLADESTDRYHALAQQDLKFARKLIPFQDSYAAGLTKLVMLLVGYVGGDIEETTVTVKVKRPVQVSDNVLQSIEAISRASIEMIDNFKKSQENNDGDQPEIRPDLYSMLMSQLGMPEDIIKLFDNAIVNDPKNPQNTPDDNNISTVTSSKKEPESRVSLNSFMFNEVAAECSSSEILLANIELFEVFKPSASGKSNLLVEVIQSTERKKLEIITSKNIPKTAKTESTNVRR